MRQLRAGRSPGPSQLTEARRVLPARAAWQRCYIMVKNATRGCVRGVGEKAQDEDPARKENLFISGAPPCGGPARRDHVCWLAKHPHPLQTHPLARCHHTSALQESLENPVATALGHRIPVATGYLLKVACGRGARWAVAKRSPSAGGHARLNIRFISPAPSRRVLQERRHCPPRPLGVTFYE